VNPSTDTGRHLARRLARIWPTVVVTILGCALIWPIPAGDMPLSADHTVHLTRAWLYADVLARFDVRAWSPAWFFGTPLGELYPVLGDVLVVLVRTLGLGLLDWHQSYAIAFAIVFVTQGWALLRAGRRMGWGPLPGLVAAVLVMMDVGAYREGGWIYVVFYGVWPQTLATSLTWLGFAELAHAMDLAERDPAKLGRGLAIAGLALGAALLAHPISVPTIAVGGPLCVLAMSGLRRARLRRAAATGLLTLGLAVGLAAWWLVPMLAHRGWMASYGWLWLPLDEMIDHAFAGQWCQSMPASVGYAIWGGLVVVAAIGRPTARFFAATAVVLWLLASRDVMWSLRLDLVGEGFTHLQYQRFTTAAKPGLYLMAGAAVGGLGRLAATAWVALVPRLRRIVSPLLAIAAVLAGGTMVRDLRQELAKLDPAIREIQRVRIPGRGFESLDADHAALAAWLHERWTERDRFWRVTVRDARNIHWFMDLPVLTGGAPVLKQGFTPGDNFVHKPEKAPPALQQLAQVRYEVRRGQRVPKDAVASFGSVHVTERRDWTRDFGVRLDGPGQVEVREQDFERGVVRVRVEGTTGPTRLVFGVGGYPRWTLEGPDGAVAWYEAPVVGEGPTATTAQRRAGELRGGKAHGDDGTEPTLIAAEIGDGEYVLRYRAWQALDLLALLLSALALGSCASLLGWPRRAALPKAAVSRIHRALERFGHPLALGSLVLAGLVLGALRVQRGRALESTRAFGYALEGKASLVHARADYFKSEMLIRPALVFDRSPPAPAEVTLRDVPLGDTLRGWVALEDDDAKLERKGTQRLTIEARAGDAWTRLVDQRIPHRPGRVELDVPAGALAGRRVELRVTLQSEGTRPPQVGFDLELGGPT
jgi:hypothetical protein